MILSFQILSAVYNLSHKKKKNTLNCSRKFQTMPLKKKKKILNPNILYRLDQWRTYRTISENLMTFIACEVKAKSHRNQRWGSILTKFVTVRFISSRMLIKHCRMFIVDKTGFQRNSFTLVLLRSKPTIIHSNSNPSICNEIFKTTFKLRILLEFRYKDTVETVFDEIKTSREY